MTRAILHVLIFLAVALVLVLGVEFLLWAVQIETPDYGWLIRGYTWRLLELPWWSRFALGILMILLPLFIAHLAVLSSREETIIKAKAANGDEIHLTEGGVRRCLREEVRAIPQVVAVAPTVRGGKQGPCVTILARVQAGSDVPSVQREIRQTVLRTLHELFGVGTIENIQVVIAGLHFGGARRRPVPARAESKPVAAQRPRATGDAPAPRPDPPAPHSERPAPK